MIYNSVTVSLPKNMVQFMLGVVLFWLVTGSFSFTVAAVAIAGFLIAYSSVYFYNDITDSDEDKDDDEKKGWKLVASGVMSRRTAAALCLLFLSAGIAISSMVNGWFLVIVLTMVSLNFLHSNPTIRLKKRKPFAAINIAVIEFLKYSSGWFAFTGNLASFPFWLILCFAFIYSAIYMVYKFRFMGSNIRDNKMIIIFLGSVAAFSYAVSLVLYEFALPMIMLLLLSIALATFSIGKKITFMRWLWVEFAILPFVLISFMLLSIPTFAQANENITGTMGVYENQVYQNLPTGVAHTLDDFREPRYSSLEDLQSAINQSLTMSSVTIFENGKE